jgi:hypothetical protein
MENPASDVVDSRAEPLGLSPPTNSTIDRLSSGLCRGGLVLFVVALLLPALYVRPTPGVGWGGTFPGYVCLAVSFVSFPCWVPNVLTIAAPFASGRTKKNMALVLGAALFYLVYSPSRIGSDTLLVVMWAKVLPFCLSAAGLLVPAHPSRTLPAGPENADAKGTKIGDGKPEPIFSRSRSRPGASLCWAGLAVAGVLGCLPFAFMRAGSDVTLSPVKAR